MTVRPHSTDGKVVVNGVWHGISGSTHVWTGVAKQLDERTVEVSGKYSIIVGRVANDASRRRCSIGCGVK